MQLNPKLVALLGSERIAFALTIGLGFIGGISAVLFAWLMSQTINAVFLNGEKKEDVAPILAGMFLLASLRALAHWGSESAASKLALGIKSRIRLQLVEHLFTLGPAFTRGELSEQNVRTGELTNSLTEGVEALDAYFSQYLPQIALAALIPLSMLVFIFPIEPVSALILLVTAPLIPIFMILIGSTAEERTRRQWLSVSRMSAYLLDVLQGLTTLKLLGAAKAQTQTIMKVSERLRGTTMDVLRITFLSALTLELVTTISTAIVAVQVGLRLLYGHLSFVEAFFVLLLAPEFYLPLRMLGARFHAGMSGTAAASRIFEILEVKGNDDEHLAEAQGDRIKRGGNIQFKDVSVRYSDGRVALERVNFEIKAGSRTIIVGASGAGKSTIAGLLLRYVEPESGEIWVDRIPLSDMLADKWRMGIAWVSQDSYLFNDSVEANICLGYPKASQEEVVRAAKLANAHDFIQALPDGYNTVIGERGTRLSAGEAQRIALARAFLMDAPMLILDEPSAHLDAKTELEIRIAMERLMQGRTTLVIAHRLNTIHESDTIILLREGRVEACGTHQELLTRSESYVRMFSQFQCNAPRSTVERRVTLGSSLSSKDMMANERTTFVTLPDQEAGSIEKLSSYRVFKRLLSFLEPHGWRMMLSILLGWATIGSGIGLMTTSAYIIAKAALHPPIAELQVAIVGVRFFGISRGLFRYGERLVSHDLTLRILASLRAWLYRAIEPLAPARLGSYRSGDLLKRMIGDISSLENLYVRGIAPPLVALLVAVSSGLFLSQFQAMLAIIYLLSMVTAGIGLPWIVRALSKRVGGEVILAQGEMSAAIVDGLQGLPELLGFGAVQRYQEHVAEIQDQLSKVQGRLGRINSAQVAGLGFLGHFATLTVLGVAIGLVGRGQVEGLFLGVIALTVLSSFEALQPLPLAAGMLESNFSAAGRLFAIADTPPAVKEPVTPRQLGEGWDMEVRDLSFAYTADGNIGSGQALEGVSFELPIGKHMAVVGPSGAGKSTLVRLLARLWDYPSGSILLNGHELSQYSGEELRAHLAVVPQNPYLFTATILDNLRIARQQVGMEEIFEAAQLAHIHDFIEGLPAGYQTWVGEHGLRLSAGERQRIALARALLMDAPVLVMDEATANLDILTERKVLESVREAWRGRSLLVITHRLVEMEALDEILVLDRGRVVERGRHADLLAAKGMYQRMWEAQQRM